MNRIGGGGSPPTTIIVLQVAGEEDVTVCHKQHSMSALIMPEVLFGKINLQIFNLTKNFHQVLYCFCLCNARTITCINVDNKF